MIGPPARRPRSGSAPAVACPPLDLAARDLARPLATPPRPADTDRDVIATHLELAARDLAPAANPLPPRDALARSAVTVLPASLPALVPGRTRLVAAGLAFILSCETGVVHAAPSPRDLAYEQAVQAEEAGDHARAAAEYARAYQLTPAGESGPRLLFLRQSVAARLRARDGGGEPREHLCQARALLRDHLAGAGDGTLAGERASLARVEQDLGGIDCDVPAANPPVPTDSSTAPPDTPTADPPVPSDTSDPIPRSPAPAVQRPVPTDMPQPPTTPDGRSPRLVRGLRIAGLTSLAIGVAALVPMSVGIGLARARTREGRSLCWSMAEACDFSNPKIVDILSDGRDYEQMVKITAPLVGVGFMAGIILLSLAMTGRARPPVTAAPRLGGGTLGFGLQGRF
ncbi:hypothetical protein [Nannocystis pusilla]|uniref:Uncharacterized protein n=1 Tax=Nannocystis pusilla TaxID=889268 RepID=A0ABS7TT09_9BACT|nr:hypothetical protein [Nannocystis pusilla]MBZ5711363.1 hypothetical protein [Nannocystis pusilla]